MQTTAPEECGGSLINLPNSVDRCQSFSDSDIDLQLVQTMETPLNGSKTAPTTSKCHSFLSQKTLLHKYAPHIFNI